MGINGQGTRRWLDSRQTPFLIVGVGLLLRLLVLSFLSGYRLQSDSIGYHQVALYLLKNEPFVPCWPPGVSYYLAAFYKVFGTGTITSRASMLALYLLLSFALYRLTKECFNRRAGNLALLLVALFPICIDQSVEPLTQLPTAVGVTVTASLLYSLGRRNVIDHAVLLGLVLGCLTLVRPSSALLIPFAAYVTFVSTRRIWAVAAITGIASLVVGAWLVKAYQMVGRFVPINYYSSQCLFIGNNAYTPLYKTWWLGSHSAGEAGVPDEYVELKRVIDRKPPEARSHLHERIVREHLTQRPDLFLLRTINRVRCFFAFDTTTASLLRADYHIGNWATLIILGLDALCYMVLMGGALLFCVRTLGRGPHDAVTPLLLGLAALYSFPYWLSFSHPTYHFPILPLGAVLAAGYFEQLIKQSQIDGWAGVGAGIVSDRKSVIALAIFLLVQVEWIVFNAARL